MRGEEPIARPEGGEGLDNVEFGDAFEFLQRLGKGGAQARGLVEDPGHVVLLQVVDGGMEGGSDVDAVCDDVDELVYGFDFRGERGELASSFPAELADPTFDVGVVGDLGVGEVEEPEHGGDEVADYLPEGEDVFGVAIVGEAVFGGIVAEG